MTVESNEMRRALMTQRMLGEIVAVFVSVLLCGGCTRQNEYREKVITLARELGTHQSSKEDVRGLIHETRFHGLTLHEDSSAEWNIEAPTEFGAKNWVLYIEFKESKVVALRVRTADGKNEHPNGAPSDKVFPPL